MKSNGKDEEAVLKHMALWEAAIPLSQAPMRFAPPPIKQKWDKAGKPSIIDVFASAFTDEDIVAVARTEVLIEAQAQMLAHLKTGAVLVLGFEPPRKLESVPTFILTKQWDISVDWAASEIASEGLRFVAVRVLTPKMGRPVLERINEQLLQAQDTEKIRFIPPEMRLPTHVSEPQQIPDLVVGQTNDHGMDGNDFSKRTQMGRPGYRSEILDAYAALQAEGCFITKPKTKGYAQIRAWIRSNRPDTRAASSKLDNDTISKILIQNNKSQ